MYPLGCYIVSERSVVKTTSSVCGGGGGYRIWPSYRNVHLVFQNYWAQLYKSSLA